MVGVMRQFSIIGGRNWLLGENRRFSIPPLAGTLEKAPKKAVILLIL